MSKIVYLTVLAIILCVVQGEEKCSCKAEKRSHQGFGLAETEEELLTPMSPWMMRDHFRLWKNLRAINRDLGSTIKTEKDMFTILLDVQHFAPNEITVKTANDYVVVIAKHREKTDEHGRIFGYFSRRYTLPKDVEPDDVVSELSSDGILIITAPRKEFDNKGVRVVPITQTGPFRQENKDADEDNCNE